MTVLTGCLLVTAVLGVRYRGQSQGGWFDTVVDARIQALLGGHPSLILLIPFGDPKTMAAVTATLTVVGLVQRRWRAAALGALAIPLACVTAELILKPLIHRTFHGGLAYPSGHATGVFAIAGVIAVLLVNPARTRLSIGLRLLIASAAVTWAAIVCAAVLGSGSHYPTDIVGGLTVAASVVLLTALLVDLTAEWLGRRMSKQR